ncbi:50S ribosomal protein L34, chloroplastic [Apostasia shenzhenica]|uniref:Large ribosomal subunit protein bL34c n=1 Tax=Apostasia shenzhenica TaxID=1088818 RepID=A0A2I0AIK1_9ASPA|nr:50S ribosomal protein L34, chloroplastic [Apostasia shenzhenica]
MTASLAPIASLSFLTGTSWSVGRRSSLALFMPRPNTTSLLRTSFLSSPSVPLSFASSSISGVSLGYRPTAIEMLKQKKHHGLIVRAGKAALCTTKRSRSRKSLARTHGFRRRMRTTGGRAILKRRRDKGRKVLCTKSNPNSGKRASR